MMFFCACLPSVRPSLSAAAHNEMPFADMDMIEASDAEYEACCASVLSLVVPARVLCFAVSACDVRWAPHVFGVVICDDNNPTPRRLPTLRSRSRSSPGWSTRPTRRAAP